MLRHIDPRRNPNVRPHEWAAARRLFWLRLQVVGGVVLAVALGLAAFFRFPVDLTRDMTPEAVVTAAGTAIVDAPAYRFNVEITGNAAAYTFPAATLTGVYQQAPQVLHLSGEVQAGEGSVPVDYWVQDRDVYMLHPTHQVWFRLRDTQLDELASFYPDNLAAPLLTGVQQVEVLGRARLPGGEAVELGLNLDPTVMLPRAGSSPSDVVEYRLWVYTRTLMPARFAIDVRTKPEGEEQGQAGVRFSYRLTWDFEGGGPLSVPDAVKTAAQDATGQEDVPAPLSPEAEE